MRVQNIVLPFAFFLLIGLMIAATAAGAKDIMEMLPYL